MVFAFSHTPIISTFAIDQQEKHGDRPWVNAKIMKVAYTIICASVLFLSSVVCWRSRQPI